jgi:hypothetical protein
VNYITLILVIGVKVGFCNIKKYLYKCFELLYLLVISLTTCERAWTKIRIALEQHPLLVTFLM